MWDWLTSPISGAAAHDIAPWAAWHARAMVLAWGVLLPLGALIARYAKVTTRQRWPHELDNKAWWHAHRGLQWSGAALMAVGLMLAWGHGAMATPSARWHVGAGWATLLLGAVQIASGLLRGSRGGPGDASMRGDHYDMTAYRRAFERLHKSLGWLAVIVGIVAIALGLCAADAPRWMPVALGTWWLTLVVAAIVLQRRGRCIDTYQAIWGPDPAHPGNRRRPIGWGVRRPNQHNTLTSSVADHG